MFGFGTASAYPKLPPANIAAFAIFEGYPVELFGRFHSSPIFLDYPDATETAEMMEQLGILALAQSVGRLDLVRSFSWSPFGLRSLESLYTDLLLAQQRQRTEPASLTL